MPSSRGPPKARRRSAPRPPRRRSPSTASGWAPTHPGAPRRQDPDLRPRDPRGGPRSERAIPSSSTPAPSPTCRRSRRKSPRGPTGGRLVCLTDGREYAVKAEPLVFGRDAGSDVVVVGGEVSRRHAEIQSTPEGYVLDDLSVNGTYVNGEADRPPAPAGPGRRHPDRQRRVPVLCRQRARTLRVRTSPAAARRARCTPRPGPAHGCPTRCTACRSRYLRANRRRRWPRPAAPLASLLVRSGALRGRRLPITVPVVNIGRADYNDW